MLKINRKNYHLLSLYLILCATDIKAVKVTLEQATKTQGGGVDVKLYTFFNLGAR